MAIRSDFLRVCLAVTIRTGQRLGFGDVALETRILRLDRHRGGCRTTDVSESLSSKTQTASADGADLDVWTSLRDAV